MGSTSSKFKKYVQHGDEFAAMQIFQSSPELRKHLDPNLSYGDNHGHNTALHFAAKHGMKHLLRTFLADLSGNPNKRNVRKETVLHAACQLSQQAQPKSFSAHDRRAACVALLLQWRGPLIITTDQYERVELSAQDIDGNTALHCAAKTGLRRCVELLLAHGAPLFIENNDRLTPCDVAMKNGQHEIAQLLESRMVFADSSDIVNEDEFENENGLLGDQEEVYSGLRTQDLQEAKDQLLVETSDMLHIPLFTAEALLRDNEWSREALLEKWMKDPVQCCLLAGVQAPASALQFSGGNLDTSLCSSPEAQDGNGNGVNSQIEIECEICLIPIPSWQRPNITMSCRHQFCSSCWERYLTVKIQDGDAHNILCPAYQCHILVPIDVIEKLVSPEMARRYLQFDIKAFVESNRSIKWCPIAGCGRAVRLPEVEQTPRRDRNQDNSGIPVTSHAVDCGNAHFFCWECLGEAHAPAGCNQWLEWHRKISEVRPEELRTACAESEDAANCLWLVTNSKQCPNCKSPIQKNEGCNHMKCSKCKYDFCWVCQESWKRHSSATGGYFRCNRFEAVHKADERQGSLITEATVRNSHVQELSRFLHFYTRFKNHENSQRLEQPLLHGVRKKMEILASVLPKPLAGRERSENTISAMTFIEDGVRELLKARRVLCGSYVYGYYLEDDGYNKTIFEFMQNELEEVTEKLSEMIARPYLRTPKAVIVQTTALTRRKRHEFVRAVAKGLVPPETPPMVRKIRPRDYSDLDMSERMDSSGPASWQSEPGDLRRTSADWQDYESDFEDRTGDLSTLGECKAPGCHRPRARNPNTGAEHAYCSLKCSRENEKNCNVYRVLPNSDYNMELVIALEMSRLQMIEDKIKKGHGDVIENVNTPGTSIAQDNNSEDTNYGIDDQLKLAIQLSLQESTAAISRQLPGAGASVSVNHAQTTDQSPSSDTNHVISMYTKTSADITVDCFLKSLANQKIDLRSFTNPDNNGEYLIQDSIGVMDSSGFFKVGSGNEDGRFQISDIHENGYVAFADDVEDYDENSTNLKRSHSTGDLCIRRSGRGFSRSVRAGPEEPRYHLDSDHSSQHDEKPEDLTLLKKMYYQLPLQNSTETNTTTTTTTTSDSMNADMEVCGILQLESEPERLGNKSGYLASINSTDESSGTKAVVVDENVKKKDCCGILKTVDPSAEENPEKKYYSNPFATLKAKLCSGQVSKSCYLSKMAVNKSIGLLSETSGKSGNRRNSDHSIPKKKQRDTCNPSLNQSHKKDGNFSKSTSFLLDKAKFRNNNNNLRIKICKSPLFHDRPKRELETDSSNEYESETGIPKSPTLFISGVSICRTPEPKSPAGSLLSTHQSSGRNSRSSSLTVCAANSNSNLSNIQKSPGKNSSPPRSKSSPRKISSPSRKNSGKSGTGALTPGTPASSNSHQPAGKFSSLRKISKEKIVPDSESTIPGKVLSSGNNLSAVEIPGEFSTVDPTVEVLNSAQIPSTELDSTPFAIKNLSPTYISPEKSPSKSPSKAKSASEPEREREMFRFPKSSTDGALSSVLHVQESNLSSDDFHEALFLLERSPKVRDSKRKKRGKKKEKEYGKEDASSAL